MSLDVKLIREHFPSLSVRDEGRPRVYLDNPAGTQVPRQVMDRMHHYLVHDNANAGGAFRTARETDALLDEVHLALADLLNAASPDEIIFGPNMTSLTFAISRSLAHSFKPGDEIILTRMEHDANVAPWLRLASEKDLKVKWLSFDTRTYQFHPEELQGLLSERVRLIAVGYASNAIGTINDIKTIARLAHEFGALVFVDAVHYMPHGPADVQELGCDFLTCSVYKFFGPHQGLLWGKRELLEQLPAYRVRPAGDQLPLKFETGTMNHECLAGTLGAMDYLTWLGETMAQEQHSPYSHFEGRRKAVHAAMRAIKEHEKKLSAALIRGLRDIDGLVIHGITDPDHLHQRVPTISFTMRDRQPEQIARHLAEENIFVWSGDYYAIEVVRHLGLAEKGGMLRVGAVHYNTLEEIDQLVSAIRRMKS